MSRRDFLSILNEYFECTLEPVLQRKGEVLRFIGDAALAIFPIHGRPARRAPPPSRPLARRSRAWRKPIKEATSAALWDRTSPR